MFGDILKKLRTDAGLKQSELAENLSISASAIGMYEQNRRNPDPDTIKKIAEFFNVSTDYLLQHNTNSGTKTLEDEFPEGIDVLMRAKEELTPAQKKKMIELMHLFLDSLDEK